MTAPDPRQMLTPYLQPWHEAIADPAAAQEAVLHRCLTIYAQTEYGEQHGAGDVETLADFRRAFPITTYESYKPLIDRVMAGEIRLLLTEEPIGWAITRGTTADESKFIPMTPTDLRMRVSAARAMLNYVAATGRRDLFEGVNLNLNFPIAGRNREGGRPRGGLWLQLGHLYEIRLHADADSFCAGAGGDRRPGRRQDDEGLGGAVRVGATRSARSRT